MYLTQAISYQNAYEMFAKKHPQELFDLTKALSFITKESCININLEVFYMRTPGDFSTSSYRARERMFAIEGIRSTCEREFEDSGWIKIRYTQSKVNMQVLGFVKNGVSISFSMFRDQGALQNWLYRITPVAIRDELIHIPVVILLSDSAENTLFNPSKVNEKNESPSSIFEITRTQLIALSPLSHPAPFLILAASFYEQELELIELPTIDTDAGPKSVINRTIEFPPEYYQAGIGIISYFGTILREKYPEQGCRVKIEQEGFFVRLVIESDNGDKEIIEKALREYELVIRGDSLPETIFDCKARVIELKNELRIAQVRIESQKDIIALQGHEICSLRSLFGHSLTNSQPQATTISINPTMQMSSIIHSPTQGNIADIINCMRELCGIVESDKSVHSRLLNLEKALTEIADKNTREEVRDSGAMKKLKKLLDDAGSTGDAVNSLIKKTIDGLNLIQVIARKYNQIAEWCGAPQVPRFFIEKDI